MKLRKRFVISSLVGLFGSILYWTGLMLPWQGSSALEVFGREGKVLYIIGILFMANFLLTILINFMKIDLSLTLMLLVFLKMVPIFMQLFLYYAFRGKLFTTSLYDCYGLVMSCIGIISMVGIAVLNLHYLKIVRKG